MFFSPGLTRDACSTRLECVKGQSVTPAMVVDLALRGENKKRLRKNQGR
jgi:hypothetical protein